MGAGISNLLASISPELGGAVLWAIFGVLLAFSWIANPPLWLKPMLAFWMSIILATAIVVTAIASGVKIDDVISVLDQLGIRSPG